MQEMAFPLSGKTEKNEQIPLGAVVNRGGEFSSNARKGSRVMSTVNSGDFEVVRTQPPEGEYPRIL